MALVIDPPGGDGPVGTFERDVVVALKKALPDAWLLLPNFVLRDPHGQSYEYDLVVLGPHAVYVIEAKEWYGRLTGDDTEWVLNVTPRPCPMPLVDRKAKVIKGRFGAAQRDVWCEPVLVVPSGMQNLLGGNWRHNLVTLDALAMWLCDPSHVSHAKDITKWTTFLRNQLTGAAGRRMRERKKTIASYAITEVLRQDEGHVEALARRALVKDPMVFRLRYWPLSRYTSPDEREQRLLVIKRPTEALARVGRHPNLLPIIVFGHEEEQNLFYEVSEWSEYGTLHSFLHNRALDRLTLRERLEIAAGVASALEAVHAVGLVHRNVCPDAVLIGFDRQARLTNFDRTYIEDTATVFAQTQARQPEYVAPELRDNASYAFDASADLWSFGVLLYQLLTDALPFPDGRALTDGPVAMPSVLRAGVSRDLDDLVGRLLLTHAGQRPTATAALAVLRDVLGHSAEERAARSTRSTHDDDPAKWGTGTLLEGRYQIEGRLGEGGFSTVFKVLHLDQDRCFAMKLLKEPGEEAEQIREFNTIGRNLPAHPNIERFEWMDRLTSHGNRLFVLTEFIDGETLKPWCRGDRQLPWADLVRVGCELLQGLAALHPKVEDLRERDAIERRQRETGEITEEDYQRLGEIDERVRRSIVHRDLKPENILIERKTGRAKIIDFNIAATLMEAKGHGGTPRYWAPDRGHPWRPDMDLFSLGVILYELVTHQHPFPDNTPGSGEPYDPRVLRPDLHLSTELAGFLLRAVAAHGCDRFATADEMRAALQAIPTPRAAPVERRAPVRFGEDERARANYNPYVTRLLTLYSQARRSNAGTRGLDDTARLTYVRTRLDDHLTPAIANNALRLLIVTGNAGDGKTAYLQQVERYFHEDLKTPVTPLATKNGARWTYEGVAYETNYDGSQDEGDTDSDAVLERFLAPFAGHETEGLRGKDARLLAINEGRLLDFLHAPSRKERFFGIARLVEGALAGEVEAPPGAMLVNLNLRSVVAGGVDSLFERQLQRLLSPDLWEPCKACSLRERCPIQHNVQTLSCATSGAEVRRRLRRHLEVLHLRRRMHVTMRDLRSVLSWVILRDHDCAEVAELLQRTDVAARDLLLQAAYTEAFAAGDGATENRVDDRVVRLLREADVGVVNTPSLDRELDLSPHAAVRWMTFDGRSEYALEQLKHRSESAPRGPEATGDLAQLFTKRRAVVERWRRRAWYERADEGWRDTLPYRSLPLLERVIEGGGAEERRAAETALRDRVLDAVSYSEGMRHPNVLRGHLALRVSRLRDPSIKSYRLFKREDFSLRVQKAPALARFLEYSADAVELVAVPSLGTARMKISLDLLEMLDLIHAGYRPSPSDLQGLFVNLQIFRNELLALPFDQVVLVPEDDATLYVVKGNASKADGIQLALSRYEVGR